MNKNSEVPGQSSKAYEKLLDFTRELYALRSAQALLGWDQETMMPPRGGNTRANAMAELSKLIQDKYCSEELGDLMDTAAAEGSQDENRIAVLRELKRDREKLLKIPPALTKEIARTISISQQDRYAVATVVGYRQIKMYITVKVRSRDEPRRAPNIIVNCAHKRAVTTTQKYRHVAAGDVCHGKVKVGVAIKVTRGGRSWTIPYRIVYWSRKSPVSISHEY